MKRIIHVIKSPSFNSDGRLQKWIKSLSENRFENTVHIVEDSNTNQQTETVGGANVNRKNLFFRSIFPQRKGYFFKVPEYFFKTVSFLNKQKFEYLIFHDVQQYLNITYYLFFHRKRNFKIIWDLHELPHGIMLNNVILKKHLRYIIRNVDLVVYTSNERRNYILNKLGENPEKKFSILNNYPDKNFIISPKQELEVPHFGNNNPYFLWLGAAINGRNFKAFFNAYKTYSEEFNLVILGKVENVFKKEIDELSDQGKLFNAFVKQSEIIKYIDNCYLSVVLYNSRTTNNFLCEPNRLYQLVCRNIPVIVGNNPTMANLINKYKIGNVLEDDGVDEEGIKNAIDAIIQNYSVYKEISKKNNYEAIFSWENQIENIIRQIK
ncbi:glycosyltransferase family protein [Flavobacterium soli]|uniref:glycosyltransferase n=1 Tax=Flavobacterium soli TaxID=344881 RepID=UPI0004219EB2|nr:glycosyltransferase [Flavobacterium soli]